MPTTTTTTTPDAATLNRAVRSLLSDNTKLRKLPNGASVINAGLAMAPARRAGVVNVCPFATAGCVLACVLWFAGRTVTMVVRRAAIARTKLWHFYPDVFYRRLHRSLTALARRAARAGVRAFCRLNVASDIEWPREIYTAHPAVTFYHYTKNAAAALAYGRGEYPANVHISYSLNERTTFDTVRNLLAHGVNIVGVVDSYYHGPTHRYGLLPARVEFQCADTGETIAVDTVDADAHDLRVPEFDGRGVFCALRLKGGRKAKEAAIRTGFARHFPRGQERFKDELRRDGTMVVVLPAAAAVAA